MPRISQPQHATRPRITPLQLAIGLHLLAALVATLQRLVGGLQINNFLIFRNSFWHLLHGQDLYAAYASEGLDLYKYSPSFALLFAPFALLPIPLGVLVWNLLNAAALCLTVRAALPARAAAITLAIAFFEALGAIQNVQSNGVVAALIIAAWLAAESDRLPTGALSIATGTAIKIFPIGAGLFGLLHRTPRRHIISCVAAGLLLLAAPLLVTPASTLLTQYRSWAALEAIDHVTPQMMWLGGLWEALLDRPLPHLPFQLLGVAGILLATWGARRHWLDPRIRQLLLGVLLIFVTLFNHQSESPTYVIGFAGIGIWYTAMPAARWRTALVIAVVLLGSVAGTDITPAAWRRVYYHQYQLKSLMVTLAWLAAHWDLWRALSSRGTTSPESPAHAAPPAPDR